MSLRRGGDFGIEIEETFRQVGIARREKVIQLQRWRKGIASLRKKGAQKRHLMAGTGGGGLRLKGGKVFCET